MKYVMKFGVTFRANRWLTPMMWFDLNHVKLIAWSPFPLMFAPYVANDNAKRRSNER